MEKLREEKINFIEVLKSFWKADEEEVSELDGELASTPNYVKKLEKEITTYDDKKKRKKEKIQKTKSDITNEYYTQQKDEKALEDDEYYR